MNDDESIVFVYGTLLKGESNHYLLSSTHNIAVECYTTGHLYDTGDGYPALLRSNNKNNKVYGELYKIDRPTLIQLDKLEGYYGEDELNEYNRVIIPVYTTAGVVLSYAYVFSEQQVLGLKQIESGRWRLC